jgi:hypothetical protein
VAAAAADNDGAGRDCRSRDEREPTVRLVRVAPLLNLSSDASLRVDASSCGRAAVRVLAGGPTAAG